MTFAPAGPVPTWLADAAVNLAAAAFNAGLGAAQTLAAPTPPDTGGDRPPTTLTRMEAAPYIRCGLAKFDRLVRAGEFPTFKLGGRRLVRRVDLDAYLAARAGGAPQST